VAIAWTAVPTLRQLATPSEFLERHNIRQIDEVQAKAMIGHKASGVFIPYPGLSSSELRINDRPFGRLRLARATNGVKYLSPRGLRVGREPFRRGRIACNSPRGQQCAKGSAPDSDRGVSETLFGSGSASLTRIYPERSETYSGVCPRNVRTFIERRNGSKSFRPQSEARLL
jgi:hypothetical protein